MELLVHSIPGFKHTFWYEECVKFKIDSFKLRKDQQQLIEAIAVYKKIQLSRIDFNRNLAKKNAVEVMNDCFIHGLFLEGFFFMKCLNSMPITLELQA